MKTIIVMFVIAAFVFGSCKKKDKTTDDCAITEANLAGNYKVTGVKYKASPSSPEVTDLSLYLEPCELDDIITFKTDHTYLYTDAGTACDPNGDDSGNWSLTGSTLNVEGEPFTLDNFSCNGFSFTSTDDQVDGDKTTVILTKQ